MLARLLHPSGLALAPVTHQWKWKAIFWYVFLSELCGSNYMLLYHCNTELSFTPFECVHCPTCQLSDPPIIQLARLANLPTCQTRQPSNSLIIQLAKPASGFTTRSWLHCSNCINLTCGWGCSWRCGWRCGWRNVGSSNDARGLPTSKPSGRSHGNLWSVATMSCWGDALSWFARLHWAGLMLNVVRSALHDTLPRSLHHTHLSRHKSLKVFWRWPFEWTIDGI